MVHVIRGAMEIEVDDAVHELAEGDTLLFDGRMPHRMRRTGGPATHALVVVSA
jgi:quercetin dioxygenase-like cupin family protein